MSSHYNLEPQPTASVIIHTTQGELAIELFAKQTPLTCRNFLQHSLDGYYDNTIFHRLVPGFIIQGGDPTATGNGGESIYDGGAFSGDFDPWPMDQRRGANAGMTGIGMKDEFHSRLRFNRRGLLGMANESKPDSNGSQFFFTLDKAEELTQKNTLFGRLSGDTIYNLAKMSEGELQEGTDRPLYPVKITNIEILVNPFEDMKKRERVAKSQTKQAILAERKKKKRPNKKLLSFGDNENDEEEMPVLKKPKYDTRIVMDTEKSMASPKKKKKKPLLHQTMDSSPEALVLVPNDDSTNTSDQASTLKENFTKESQGTLSTALNSSNMRLRLPQKTALQQANEEIAALKASIRDDRPTEAREDEAQQQEASISNELVPENAARGRKRKQKGSSILNEASTVSALQMWMSKLEKAPTSKHIDHASATVGSVSDTAKEGDESELCDLHFIANCMSCKSWNQEQQEHSDDEGWMANALTAAPDTLGKDLTFRKKMEEELIVIDPREKAKVIREERRAKRETKPGGTGREWDQTRNTKLARASALAGRGAR